MAQTVVSTGAVAVSATSVVFSTAVAGIYSTMVDLKIYKCSFFNCCSWYIFHNGRFKNLQV